MENKRILDACFELARGQPEGCLFVVEFKRGNGIYYKDYNPDIYRKDNRRLSVFNEHDKQTIRKLAALDGAIIIDPYGFMLHYGATLIHSGRMIGHGKRHAFALGTSKKIRGTTCILASEEDGHIRAFANGFCTTDIDSATNLTTTNKQKLMEFLDMPITKTLIVSGIATSVLTLNPLPAIITISGSYAVISEGFGRIKTMFRR